MRALLDAPRRAARGTRLASDAAAPQQPRTETMQDAVLTLVRREVNA